MTESIALSERTNVLKNIFKLQESNGAENQFTAAWGYMLDREPALAQAVADILLKDRNLVAKVIRVTDHPKCDSLLQPDFCIECEGFDILVEHKLDALLHENQLENYHDLALDLHPRTTYVALIAPAYQPVPKDVLNNSLYPMYLKPADRDHFRWSDFHGAVKSQPGRLTQELADYMASLGMAHFTLKGAEDIFDRGVKPVQFDDALKLAAEQVFVKDNQGCWLKGNQSGLCREVRTPLASLTLIYIWAEQRSTYVMDCDGPVLAVNVFERDTEGSYPLEAATMMTPSGFAVRRYFLENSEKLGEGTCRITYVAPLDKIIQETREATVRCMAEMLTVVHADFWPEDLSGDLLNPTAVPAGSI